MSYDLNDLNDRLDQLTIEMEKTNKILFHEREAARQDRIDLLERQRQVKKLEEQLAKQAERITELELTIHNIIEVRNDAVYEGRRLESENALLKEALEFIAKCGASVRDKMDWTEDMRGTAKRALSRQDMQAPGVENQGLNSEKLYKSPEPATIVQDPHSCSSPNAGCDSECVRLAYERENAVQVESPRIFQAQGKNGYSQWFERIEDAQRFGTYISSTVVIPDSSRGWFICMNMGHGAADPITGKCLCGGTLPANVKQSVQGDADWKWARVPKSEVIVMKFKGFADEKYLGQADMWMERVRGASAVLECLEGNTEQPVQVCPECLDSGQVYDGFQWYKCTRPQRIVQDKEPTLRHSRQCGRFNDVYYCADECPIKNGFPLSERAKHTAQAKCIGLDKAHVDGNCPKCSESGEDTP